MTTYTLTGFSLEFSDTTGDGNDDTVVVGTSELNIVLPDGDLSFYYTVTFVPEGPNELPTAEVLGNNAYNIRVNGDLVPQEAEAAIGEMQWGAGNVGQFLGLYGGPGLSHIFTLNGDDLGITSPADVAALDTSVTYSGVVLEEGWQAGDIINFADLLNVSITENDRIYGDTAANTFSGGIGKDRIWGENGKDTLDGNKGNDRLFGGNGHDSLNGGAGNDKLYGENGHDVMNGGKGKDLLKGGDGDDTLTGGRGGDTLEGGAGDDWLTGGGGNDVFILKADAGWDTVIDFENNDDTLRLDAGLWDGALSVAEVIDLYASPASGEGYDGVMFEFDGGGGIFLNGVTVGQLGNDVEIF